MKKFKSSQINLHLHKLDSSEFYPLGPSDPGDPTSPLSPFNPIEKMIQFKVDLN
jgi:hypothetical protein